MECAANVLRPGDPCPGFMAEPGGCRRMVYDRNLQATHISVKARLR
jgi:hypothetical protein